MNKQLKFLALVMMCICLFIAGCSDQSKQQNSSNSQVSTADNSSAKDKSLSDSSAKDSEPQTLDIAIYFPDENGEKLIKAQRTIDLVQDGEEVNKYMAVVQELIDGTKSKSEGINIMPKNTKVLGVNIDNKGIVTVDFNKAFKQNFSGGSTGELMLIGSITNSLTEFKEVKGVKFTIEGKQINELSGHLDLTQPQTRMEDLF